MELYAPTYVYKYVCVCEYMFMRVLCMYICPCLCINVCMHIYACLYVCVSACELTRNRFHLQSTRKITIPAKYIPCLVSRLID